MPGSPVGPTGGELQWIAGDVSSVLELDLSLGPGPLIGQGMGTAIGLAWSHWIGPLPQQAKKSKCHRLLSYVQCPGFFLSSVLPTR